MLFHHGPACQQQTVIVYPAFYLGFRVFRAPSFPFPVVSLAFCTR
nr:RNA polymerase II subunit [Drosophila melanogaster]